ncbi:MAG: AAA family ATPase [Bacteroidetes bacterium RIFCSPLOWO2_12_FULL_35_15]|nr:MAG: AAA family ATPase [Bacteroidetes bacterium RIFCSPLOWO2_12_FULL_35_15]
MINRTAEKLLKKYSRQFRALAVVGPRQSGKTTLVRKVFPNKPYVSLENPDEQLQANTDPRAFLSRFRNGAIIDEAQRVPALFSYLQQILDETKKEGLFILTGSNNFLLQQSVTQSLAGRIGYVDLLPLSFNEINTFEQTKLSTNELILTGCYPELYDKHRKPGIWYPAYIRTYIERDVKQLRNIDNTLLFTRFIQLCAGRIGQQLSVSALSNECGIDVKTVNSWLSILQSSYIIYLIPPHQKNFNKRVVKTPKLYFIDTGLACSLLGIRQEKEVANSHFRGALFENYVVTELLKLKYNSGSYTNIFFWRDNKGVEIDILLDNGSTLFPIQIKASQTFQESHLKPMQQWNNFSGNVGGLLLYDGEQEFTRKDKIRMQNWKTISKLKI